MKLKELGQLMKIKRKTWKAEKSCWQKSYVRLRMFK